MEPFKRSRDPPPKGSDMDQDEDTAFADNYAERDQAKALREQARAGGLRFAAYLTGDQDDRDRKSVVSGKSVAVSVDPGGRRTIKTKKECDRTCKRRVHHPTKHTHNNSTIQK